MKVRSRARVVALQALFEIDCVGHDPETVIKNRLADSDLPPHGEAFVRTLVEGVLKDVKELDALISRYAPEWPVEQMAIIDRNILRIALYEILTADKTPVKVSINEAVELAKLFGSGSSRRFVNGVLGSFVAHRKRSEWEPNTPFPPERESEQMISEVRQE